MSTIPDPEQQPEQQPQAPFTPPPPPPGQHQIGQQFSAPPATAPGGPGGPVGGAPQVLDPQQQRTWGMLSHLIGLAAMVFSAGFLGFAGSLVVYLLYRERGDFVRRHAANSVNVQIMMGILTVVGVILCVTIIGLVVGIPLLIAAWGWAFVVHIIGAVKANNGELWDPPLMPRFVQ